MANQELYNKTYKIPSDVLRGIQATLVSTPHGEGVKRAKFMLKNGYLTYQALKRLKNFFDYFNPQTDDKAQYALAGGQPMKTFIETTLNQDRAGVQRSKQVRRDVNTNPNSELKPYSAAPDLNESEKKKELKQNVVAVIVNDDNKILLLKRSDFKDQWMPNKWALVGGAIDDKEKPEEAVKREIKEETGLEIDKVTNILTIQRHKDSEETIFACRFDGESTEITLNKENSNYGWYDVSEMEFLDIVPHLIEYITLIFKKYD